MRGNGWYEQPIIDYCLELTLITEGDIKQVLYSGLSIPAEYFNPFIDYLGEGMGQFTKLAANTMIGGLKRKVRKNWKTRCITQNPNTVNYHFLEANGCHIYSRKIGDQDYHQVYEEFITSREESEAPIYNMILALEAIELHKLMMLIEKEGGLVLDVSTDEVACVFPTDKLPWTLEPVFPNVKGFYYDKMETIPKYKLVEKDDDRQRLRVEKLPQYIRKDTFLHQVAEWEIIEDVDDNDFTPLVNMIVDSKQSFHIDGRAGTGKSTLVLALQAEMTKRNITFKTLAPTNKACRVIGGKTIHSFVASCCTTNALKEAACDYVFADEISMVPELFYKFFITMKRIKKDTKFIIAEDFEQLLPVKDRVKGCDYKNSTVLNELCNGNRLQLSKCRRSDDTLYKICLRVWDIKITDFAHEWATRHIAFTNHTRKWVNDKMMEVAAKNASRNKSTILELKALDYEGNSQNVKLCAGTPIVARVNRSDMDLFNNEQYVIKQIKVKKELVQVQLEDGEHMLDIPFKEFQKLFYPTYCITVHSSQGSTFKHKFTIHEWSRYCDRMKYVALSRATCVDNICVWS